ncbi:MAG: DNA polymerase I [Candidatus Omnitrophica bacterium]|nr:DNA polymerase I [Candidatus Omnitrophota bacterium]MDD5512772.1 DNA polymerase I [Candidatus Omnitrophota bacterium]
MKNQELYLIDATAFCYRAFFALSGFATSFGQPTNAVFGFVNMLNKILKENKPQYLAACFDVSRETQRQKKFAEYKIQRPPMPDGLSSQIPLIKQIVAAYGIAIVEKEGYEADDLIATLVARAKDKGIRSVVISSDKDMLQLVDDSTVVFSPYKDAGTLYDRKKVFERYEVEPGQIIDVLALMGDKIDNIPGISGIGEKTAVNLIREFGSVEKLLRSPEAIKSEKISRAIQEHKQQVILNKELVSLDHSVALDFNLDDFKASEPDRQELFKLFKYLEFKSFLKNVACEEESRNCPQGTEKIITDRELKEIFASSGELIFSSLQPPSVVICAQEKFLRLDQPQDNFKGILADPGIRKIGHDLKKSKVAFARQGFDLGGAYFDTMIAAYLVNPSRGSYELTDLAWEYFQESYNQQILSDQVSAGLIARLVPRLEKELEEKSLSGLFRDIEMPLVEVLAEMENNGIKLDLAVLKELSLDLDKRLAELNKDIFALSMTEFNINSPKQLREVLFEKLKLPVVKRTKTGASTDEEVLRKLAAKHELPAMILEYRQMMKLKTTYVDTLPGLIDKTSGKIHTSFNQTGTETGRLSSANPNLQNIPVKSEIGSRIRKAIIVSDEKNFMLAFDYSQIELRILAHISKDAQLVSAFKQEKDVHRITAALIYGLDEKEVTDQMREMAKRINFAIIYGLSAYGLSRDLNISHEESQQFIDAYFLRYPGVKDYIDSQIKRAEQSGFVTTIMGRRRYLPEINNKNLAVRQFAQRQAVNTPIQGSASDLIKLAMIQIHNRIESDGLQSRMLIQIHDELVFEVPPQEFAQAVALIKDKMENVLTLDVPIRVGIKEGKNWLKMREVK